MMLLFAIAALISTVSTFLCAIVCVLNFNNGLMVLDRWRRNVARESSLFRSGYRRADFELPPYPHPRQAILLE